MVKTIFIDIDGTLLNRNHILTQNTINALNKAYSMFKKYIKNV